jgi:hypothetical protein
MDLGLSHNFTKSGLCGFPEIASPALLSKVRGRNDTLTLTLSHQGRGDMVENLFYQGRGKKVELLAMTV